MSVIIDETGLHSPDCECMRCESGFRPTSAERWHAEQALLRRRERGEALPETRARRVAREINERHERETREAHQCLRAEQKRFIPLTPEQAAELRAEHPEIHRGTRR